MNYKIFYITFLVFALVSTPVSFATEIPIEGYVGGGLSLQGLGGWMNGINFSSTTSSSQEAVVHWDANIAGDLLAFADDTTTAGFQVLVSVSDFNYTGNNSNGVPLPASNIKLIFHYVDALAGEPTRGFDDSTKNINILTGGDCTNLQLTDYSFHPDFSDSGKNYSLTGSNNAAVIFSTALNCLNFGYLRMDRVEATIPAYSPAGSFDGNITFTIMDGI